MDGTHHLLWVQSVTWMGTHPLLRKRGSRRFCCEDKNGCALRDEGTHTSHGWRHTHKPWLLHIFFLTHCSLFVPRVRLIISLKWWSDIKYIHYPPGKYEKPTHSTSHPSWPQDTSLSTAGGKPGVCTFPIHHPQVNVKTATLKKHVIAKHQVGTPGVDPWIWRTKAWVYFCVQTRLSDFSSSLQVIRRQEGSSFFFFFCCNYCYLAIWVHIKI